LCGHESVLAPFPEAGWFEALRDAAAADDELAVIGRWCTLDLVLEVDENLVLLRLREGRISEIIFDPDIGISSSRPSRSPCLRLGSSHSRKGSKPGGRWSMPRASNRPSKRAALVRTIRTFLPQAIRTATPSNPSLAGGNCCMTSGSWPGTT